MEGVVLGGSLEEPFAIRYAVMAYPDGRCRSVTARAIGDPIPIELFADGKGGWTDDDGVLIRGLDGALDVDLGITPIAHALTIRRLALRIGASAVITVAGIDVLGGEIRFDEHRYVRLGNDHHRIEDVETGQVRSFIAGARIGRSRAPVRLPVCLSLLGNLNRVGPLDAGAPVTACTGGARL
jgi:hypothetical protein